MRKNKEQKEEFDSEKRSLVKDIGRWLSELGEDEFSFDVQEGESSFLSEGDEVLTCKVIRPKSVKYDGKAVYDKIGKPNAKVVVSKQYSVNDMNGLIELLKEYGVDPKRFKKYISVGYTVDEKKLEQLYDTGIVKLEDLKGCYTVEKKTPYLSIKVSRKK